MIHKIQSRLGEVSFFAVNDKFDVGPFVQNERNVQKPRINEERANFSMKRSRDRINKQ